MTWNAIAQQSTTYSAVNTDLFNGYVFVDYVVSDYILESDAWTVISQVSSTWTAA